MESSKEKETDILTCIKNTNEALSKNITALKDSLADLKKKESQTALWEKIKAAYNGHNTKGNIFSILNDKEYRKSLDLILTKLDGLEAEIISIEEIKNGPEFEKIFEDLKKKLNKFDPEKIPEATFAEFKGWLRGCKSLIQDKTKLNNLPTNHIYKDLKLDLLNIQLKKKFKDIVQKYLEYCKKSQVEETYNQKFKDLNNLYGQLDLLINNLTNLCKKELIFCKKKINDIAIDIINKEIFSIEDNLEMFIKKLVDMNGKLERFVKDYWNDETSQQFNTNLFESVEPLFQTDLSNFYIANMKRVKSIKEFIELQTNWYSKLVEITTKIKKLI